MLTTAVAAMSWPPAMMRRYRLYPPLSYNRPFSDEMVFLFSKSSSHQRSDSQPRAGPFVIRSAWADPAGAEQDNQSEQDNMNASDQWRTELRLARTHKSQLFGIAARRSRSRPAAALDWRRRQRPVALLPGGRTSRPERWVTVQSIAIVMHELTTNAANYARPEPPNRDRGCPPSCGS
jgi:hypothetical protein